MAIQAQMYPENLGLPLMGGSQDWFFMSNNNNQTNNNMVFNGCGFNEFQQQKQQQQQIQFQQQQSVLLQLQQQYLVQLQNQQQKNNSCYENNNNNNNNDGFMSSRNCTSTTTASTTTTATGSDYNQISMNFSPVFADQFEKQTQEIDRFINLQNERLKLALQEQRKQQLATIMRKLEAKAMQLMIQKDEELARATKRRIELEDIITKMEIENQEWQRLAAENEAMVLSLNNTLEQIKEQACSSSCSSNEFFEDGAESCCNVGGTACGAMNIFSNNINEETTSVRGRAWEADSTSGGSVVCKVCKSGKSSILLLPCRHLCCCKGCEALVDVCPVCKSSKMASIEALIS